jgi:hypothetical protein
MNPHGGGFFVVAAIKDADPATFRQALNTAPKIVVVEFFRRGPFERKDLTTLRVDAGHDVLDGAVLAGRIKRLKDQQD